MLPPSSGHVGDITFYSWVRSASSILLAASYRDDVDVTLIWLVLKAAAEFVELLDERIVRVLPDTELTLSSHRWLPVFAQICTGARLACLHAGDEPTLEVEMSDKGPKLMMLKWHWERHPLKGFVFILCDSLRRLDCLADSLAKHSAQMS